MAFMSVFGTLLSIINSLLVGDKLSFELNFIGSKLMCKKRVNTSA